MLKTKPGRQPDWKGAIEALIPPTKDKAEEFLDKVGEETLAWLQTRNPEERGWIARTPGGLADSYKYDVSPTSNGARLVLRNTKFTAVILEHRDGLFVLSGVTDPGGPVEKKMMELGEQYGFRVVRSG